MNRLSSLVRSVFDPGSYIHLVKLLHYYNYSYVRERRKLGVGDQTRMAPNISFRFGDRITIGSHCHLGERCYLWAGASTGRIRIGNFVSFAPNVFVTASDYRFVKGRTFRDQPKRERDVTIGDDVWLGTGVIITAGVTIGDGCIVAAGAVVTKDLPPDSIAAGVPARVVGAREPEAVQSALNAFSTHSN